MPRRGLPELFSAVKNHAGSPGPILPLGLALMKSQESREARSSWTQPKLKETATGCGSLAASSRMPRARWE